METELAVVATVAEVVTSSNIWVVVVLAALLAISEVIALTSLKSNSIFTLIYNVLKKLAGK